MAGVVIAECSFAPALTGEGIEEWRAKIQMCFRVRFVKWTTTHFAADGSRAILVLEASDAETVRNAFRSSGLAFDRVWPATT